MISRNVCSMLLIALVLLFDPPLHAEQNASSVCSGRIQNTGIYFDKKAYVATPLPKYEEVRSQLPSPVKDGNPPWVQTYWKAWELAFHNFHEPEAGSRFVSQFIDASFNDNIFLWDSSFMTMFASVASPLVPAISTLDNFYSKQLEDGEICREIVRSSGTCYTEWVNIDCKALVSHLGWSEKPATDGWAVTYKGRSRPSPNPLLTLDALDNPILAWAELESYRITGDGQRLIAVWEPLVRYYRALQKYLRQGNGLYMTDWASMDNSPRNPYLGGGGTAIDTSSQMVLFARNLSQMADLLGKSDEAAEFARDANALSGRINKWMWNAKRGFYFDLTMDGRQVPVKTIAGFWTLIAGVASSSQAEQLVRQLMDPRAFGRPNSVPTLAADEPLYDPAGGYWKGAVWAPTTTMVIRGLEAYGYHDLARRIAIQHLNLVADVYLKTGTIWENYSPERVEAGEPARQDFVGWSGIGPILYLLEYGIGLKPDARRNELTWDLQSGSRQGCEHFRFNGHVSSLIAELDPNNPRQARITVDSDGEFALKVVYSGTLNTFRVVKGLQQFSVKSGR